MEESSREDRLRATLAGSTMRMYVRISRIGDRRKAGGVTPARGERTLWSDDTQLAVGRRCAAQWGMVFDEEESLAHADPDVSGYKTKWERRPGLRAHYEDARRGEFKVLGLHFADRMGRNVRETVDAIKAFLALGVLIYVAEDGKFISEDDKVALNDLHGQMVSSERFSIRLAERVRAAHEMRAKSGLHHGGPPPAWLEYDKATNTYVVIEVIAELMRLMVEMRLEGKSETAITRKMNDIRPTAKGFPWRQCNVNRYLSVKFIEKMEGFSHFCVKDKDPILVPNAFPAILSPEKAAEIKRVLASANKRTYYEKHFANKAQGRTRAVGANANFLLTGRIFCAICHRKVGGLSGNKDGAGGRYACYTAMGTSTRHPDVQTYFRRHHVEDAVLLALTFWLKEPPPPMPAATAAPTRDGLRQVKRLNEQIDALYDMYELGEWSKEDYLRKHQALVERRDEMQRKLADDARPSAVAAAQEIVAGPPSRVRLRELIHLLVERVELPVYSDERQWGVRGKPRPYVRVVLRYPMPDGARSLLSPICWDRYTGPRRVIAE